MCNDLIKVNLAAIPPLLVALYKDAIIYDVHQALVLKIAL